jgi:hypothetical protein
MWISGGRVNSTGPGAFVLMMDYDEEQGTYHSRQNNWQQFFGYNSIYDFAFDLGANEESDYFEFMHCVNGKMQAFRFWAWKGDYLNLGAGAELGIYQQTVIPGHFKVNKDFSLPMSMTLTYDGEPIGSYNPSDPHWWITIFNPAHKRIDVDKLSATFIVDFSSNTRMFNNFRDTPNIAEDRRWSFNTSNHTAQLDL